MYKEYFDIWEFTSEDVVSNFDHEINYNIVKELQEGNFISNYPAINFYAKIIFYENKFIARIKCYGEIVDYLESVSIEDLEKLCCDKYGYE